MSLLQMLTQQLGGQTAQQIGSQIGSDPSTTQKALTTALPLLLGGLARNANKSPEGAQSLANALEQDHDGSVLDSLSGLLGGSGGGSGLGGLLGMAGGLLGGGSPSRATDGDGILRHVLGERRGAIEQGVAKASGLDAGKTGQLLSMLAPLVMGALGKAKRQQNLDADGVAALLNRERAQVESETPGMAQGGLLGLLDMDDDGSIADDVAKIGAALGGGSILGKLFGGK